MVFFNTNQNENVYTCAYSIALLNYNCGVTSYVLYIKNGGSTQESAIYAYATLSLMLGLLIGQVLFGIFGDLVGRRLSFQVSSFFLIIGSFLSIFSGMFSNYKLIIAELSIFRLILGFGSGGLYPLIAAITRESSQQSLANSNVALVFGPLGSIGLVLAPVFALAASYLFKPISNDLQWRIVVATGAFASLPLLWLDIDETYLYEDTNEINGLNKCSKRTRVLFFGSSISWFLSDFLHYGNIMMQAKFIDSLTRNKYLDDITSAKTIAYMGIATASSFWIGGVLSVYALKRVSALALQLQGFLLSAATFFSVTYCRLVLPSSYWPITLLIYSFTFVCNGYGPGPTTFLLPSLLFGQSIRTTANGVAAAFGKVGALFGIITASLFGFEISMMMACFGAFSLMGSGSTLVTMQYYFRNSTKSPRIYRRANSMLESKEYIQISTYDDNINKSQIIL